MAKMFQALNPRTDAWVKMKKMANGKTQIMDVKQNDPTVPFDNIPFFKKKKKR